MKYVVVGGAGKSGQSIVKDLLSSTDKTAEIVVGDVDFTKAVDFAASLKNSKVKATWMDTRDRNSVVNALSEAQVLINAAHYQSNIEAMEAALEARVHYVDLGGLFHMTKSQLELDEAFKGIEKTALLGMGAAPGVTNVLAAVACEKLSRVQEIHCRVAFLDKSTYKPEPALNAGYSVKTILEALSMEPAVFSKGHLTFLKPLSGAEKHSFPSPVGQQTPIYVIHSEVATLPLSFHSKGIRDVSFKLSFDQEFFKSVQLLKNLGLASEEEIKIGELLVKPIDVVVEAISKQSPCQLTGKPKQTQVIRAIVKGHIKSKPVTVISDAIFNEIDSGIPTSIAAQMLAHEQLVSKGVTPPEGAIPLQPFIKQLQKRKVKIRVTQKSGWKSKV